MSRVAGRPRVVDALLASAAYAAALIVLLAFGWLLADVIVEGLPHLSLSFLVTAPEDAGRAGGIGPILVSTLGILSVCTIVVVPLGLATALFLSEITTAGDRRARLVRRSLDGLAAVPSIVFGLVGNLVLCRWMGLGFSILSGGLTLACMVLPFVIRAFEIALTSVPHDTRRAAAALAIGRVTTIRRLVLPVAAPGIVVAVVLGIGRALAETAALVFTSGYASRMPGSLLDSGRALSVHVYDLAMNVPGGDRAAYASALVLVVMLVVIHRIAASLTVRLLGARGAAGSAAGGRGGVH